jgi:aprataxin
MITGKKRKFVPLESDADQTSGSNEAHQDSAASISDLQKGKNSQKTLPAPVLPFSSATLGLRHRPSFNLNVLYDYLRNPSKYEASVVYSDDNCIIIKDVYPKSSFHFLLLAKESFLHRKSVAELVPNDLGKLKKLHNTAKEFAQQVLMVLSGAEDVEKTLELPEVFQEELKEKKGIQHGIGEFKLGYHIVPSLYPLHLHIITDDYNSPCLKTKSHWNSFVTDYFLPIDRLERWLFSGKKIIEFIDEPHSEELLKLPLKCHKCSTALPNFPQLKAHLLTHFR